MPDLGYCTRPWIPHQTSDAVPDLRYRTRPQIPYQTSDTVPDLGLRTRPRTPYRNFHAYIILQTVYHVLRILRHCYDFMVMNASSDKFLSQYFITQKLMLFCPDIRLQIECWMCHYSYSLVKDDHNSYRDSTTFSNYTHVFCVIYPGCFVSTRPASPRKS